MKRRPRLLVVLGVLVLVGLPFAIATSLLSKGLSMARPGPQPGGEVTGRVVDLAGVALEGVRVEVFVLREEPVPPVSTAGLAAPQPVAQAVSGADGTFRCAVPPAVGVYRVYAGGGELRRVGVDHSWIGLAAGARPAPLEFALEPGCTLEVRIEREGGVPVTGGVLGLSRRARWYELIGTPFRVERAFRGGSVVLDGLPAMTADVDVRLDSGAELAFEVELQPGTKVSRFQL